jgi:transcriptional regulator with XRE-family HTH domain
MTAEQIKSIRSKTGLNQREFCEKYNFAVSTFRKWEKGDNPPGKTAVKNLEKINISLSNSDSFDFNMELDMDDFNIDFDFGGMDTRYMKPKIGEELKKEFLQYSKAEDLAANCEIKKNFRMFCFVAGTFYFGDFIEALIVKKNLHVKNLTISTLSLNDNNVDSMANLLNGDYVDQLNLIVSHYFYSHERWNLIPYLYKELDKEDKFQIAVCRTHCKIVLIELYSGEKIVIHGSANLRSSGNLEQMMIEENKEMYDFAYNYQMEIVKKYHVIDLEEKKEMYDQQ